jgi:hypothetical protein
MKKDEARKIAAGHYPDRHIALVEQSGNVGLTATVAQSEIADLGVAQDPLG